MTPAIRTRWCVASIAFMTLNLAAGAYADPGDERWSGQFDRPGPTGRAFALDTWNGQLVAGGYQPWATDGQEIPYLVIVGEFGLAGGVPALGIARWDGAQRNQPGSGLGNNVTSLFTVGDPIDYIGYWDGADWQPMGSGVNFPADAWFHDAIAGLLYVDGGRAASGVYFLQVRTPEAVHSRKVIRPRASLL